MDGSIPIIEINRENFQLIRGNAIQELQNAENEFSSLKEEHKIPYVELISTIIPNFITVVLIYFDPSNLHIYLVFWIIASLMLLMSKSARSLYKDVSKMKTVEQPTQLFKKFSSLSEDKKGKTLFLALGKMLLINFKPFSIAFSLIFLINVIILIFFYRTGFDFGLYTIIIFLLSLSIFVISGLTWWVKNYPKEFPESLLNMDAKLKNFKQELDSCSRPKQIFTVSFLIVFLIAMVVFLIALIFSPFILTIFLMIQFKDQLLTHIFQFFIIIIGQFLFLLTLEVFLSRYYTMKWIEYKIIILKSSTIASIDATLSDPSFFVTKKPDEIKLRFDFVRLNFLKSMIYTTLKIDYFGFFIRRLLVLNLNIIQNDEDIKILEDYFENPLN